MAVSCLLGWYRGVIAATGIASFDPHLRALTGQPPAIDEIAKA
jgi:hypothetical protein